MKNLGQRGGAVSRINTVAVVYFFARRIVRDAAEQIDALVRRLSECGASRVALLGGLASSMQPWLAPDVQRRLVPVEGDAVDGALHLARRPVMKR